MMKVRTVSDKNAYHTEWEQKPVQGNSKNPGKSGNCRNSGILSCQGYQKFNFWKLLIGSAFVFYVLCVLYLMFFERLLWGDASQFHKILPDTLTYQQAVRRSLQLCPLKTIRYFAKWLHRDHPLFPLAFKNLVGNLALFFPMGIFLPCLFRKQRNPFRFCLTLTVMICGAEIVQALALLGKCDIDDYILNMLGAFAGWLCFQMFYLFRFLCNLLRKRVIYARWKQ